MDSEHVKVLQATIAETEEKKDEYFKVMKAFEQENERLKKEIVCYKDEHIRMTHQLKHFTCVDNANQHRIDNQDRLVRAFKEHLIKGVIDFDKEKFIKYVTDYQFENSRGFGRG